MKETKPNHPHPWQVELYKNRNNYLWISQDSATFATNQGISWELFHTTFKSQIVTSHCLVHQSVRESSRHAQFIGVGVSGHGFDFVSESLYLHSDVQQRDIK